VNSESRQNVLLIVALLGVGAAAWFFQMRAPLAVDPTPLSGLPQQLVGWEGADVALDDEVIEMLQADYHVQRIYVNRAGGLVWLYVGYYGTERGGRSEHSPLVCYPAAGWALDESRHRILDVPGGGRVNEIFVERAGERRLVHFWYRSHRSTHLVTESAQAWDRFVGRLVDGRADGAFVRVSAPLLGSNEDAVRTRLLGFGSAVDAELAEHWPREPSLDERPETLARAQ
jgi:EpsI family protein